MELHRRRRQSKSVTHRVRERRGKIDRCRYPHPSRPSPYRLHTRRAAYFRTPYRFFVFFFFSLFPSSVLIPTPSNPPSLSACGADDLRQRPRVGGKVSTDACFGGAADATDTTDLLQLQGSPLQENTSNLSRQGKGPACKVGSLRSSV